MVSQVFPVAQIERKLIHQFSVSTQQICTVVLEIRNSLNTVDTRFTYFQAPYRVEDALGFIYPILSEWAYAEVENAPRFKFKEGPGASAVQRGNFELCKTKKRSEQLNVTSRLLPGMEITMAIIIATDQVTSGDTCPKRRCGSSDIDAYPGGGFKWYVVRLYIIKY
jgi:hypothetical protein